MRRANQFALARLRELLAAPPGGGTLRERLAAALRAAIVDGRLPAELELPGTRALAAALGVGRSTLVEVVEQLGLEGYLVTRAGAATRVAHLPPALPARPAGPAAAEPIASPRWRLDDPPTPVRWRAFRPGLPDLGAFPARAWATHLARRARRPGGHDLGYADAAGAPALRRELLAHLRQTRGVDADPAQLLVVPSAQAAFDVLARAALAPGDTAWVEDPGYPGMRAVLRGAGARIVALPVDADGLVLPRRRRVAPKLVYVTPSHQYPTGVTLSLPRRLALLALARASGALLVEDDYDSELQFRGQPLASLQGLDRDGCVAYVGTFSKTLAPALRVAYLVVPPRWRALAETIAVVTGHAVPLHVQLALADFLADGGLRRQLRRANAEAALRLRRLAAGLRALGDARLVVPEPRGGLQLCVGWRGRCSDTEVVAELARDEVAAVAVSTLAHAQPRPGLLLGIGLTDAAAIDAGVARLARALARLR